MRSLGRHDHEVAAVSVAHGVGEEEPLTVLCRSAAGARIGSLQDVA